MVFRLTMADLRSTIWLLPVCLSSVAKEPCRAPDALRERMTSVASRLNMVDEWPFISIFEFRHALRNPKRLAGKRVAGLPLAG
jgi:hypothetical protein